MGGISSGGGIFSGINSEQIIQQLLAIESRPKLLAQRAWCSSSSSRPRTWT
jgi:hypothetical protein